MVPEELQSYISGVRIVAYDDEGGSVETALPIGVHRPMEVIYDGRFEIAERYEPVPVSGCIPGSIDSRVSYEERVSESRQQSVSMTISTNWRQGQSNSVSQNTSEGISIGESRSQRRGESLSESESLQEGYGLSYNENESNSVGYSSSDGESWSWDLSQGESQEDYETPGSKRC